MLECIHDAGIVHGNLGLDNLLIDDAGEVAIVDFEQARFSCDTNKHYSERQSLISILRLRQIQMNTVTQPVD
jgi:serine/threonine protein kinase